MSRLIRPINEMPDYIISALDKNDFWGAYNERPAYRQNDYVGWIVRAKREETRYKRLAQMLNELRGGTTHMKMSGGRDGLRLINRLPKVREC